MKKISINDILIDAKLVAYQKGILTNIPSPEGENNKIIYVENGKYILKDYDTQINDNIVSTNTTYSSQKIADTFATKEYVNNKVTTSLQEYDAYIKNYINQQIQTIANLLEELNTGSGV